MTSSTHSYARRAALAVALIATLLFPSVGSASGPLKLGTSGNNVKTVQKQLTSLGYYNAGVDGKFDKDLLWAVKAFQDANGLKVTGQVDSKTRDVLDSGDGVTAAEFEKARPLKEGMKGSAVKTLQSQLKDLKYYTGKITGEYGAGTKTAVGLFQKANGLKANGIATTETRKLLNSGKGTAHDTSDDNALKYGASGNSVASLQKRLKALGYKVTVNGKYDKTTVSAVKVFQKTNGLTVNGAVDDKTKARMKSDSAIAAGGSEGPVEAEPTLRPTATPKPTEKPTATPKPTRKPTATPKPASTPVPDDDDKGDSSKIETLVAVAKKQMGKPYVLGATGTAAFDCSSFTQYCYRQVGVTLPRTAYMQGYSLNKTRLTKSQLKRGDLMIFNTISDNDRADHVGIYLGDGKFIHASSTHGQVIISSLSGYDYFSWGFRIL